VLSLGEILVPRVAMELDFDLSWRSFLDFSNALCILPICVSPLESYRIAIFSDREPIHRLIYCLTILNA